MEHKSNNTQSPHFHKRKRNLCLIITIVAVLGLGLLLLILGFIVFKPKHPITTINSVNLNDFRVSLDIPNLSVYLNVTLNVNLSVKNPNKAGFKYGNGTALLKYKEEVVGEVPVPAGRIGSGETLDLDLMLTVLADRLLSNSNVYADVVSGTLFFSTYIKISGRVSVMNIFKHHLVSITSCDLSINVLPQTIENSECKYKTRL
ncbi:hypothetical protein GIB67_041987 [Kingdonia uniflora]|uniref:Late embryogenesis abundant protein LEA-2 subgroup domain-containing protein n=1 Tax=Kingdonia uniflora TaxID=39325 RepID=A0A7J7P0E9_9MAGN|nr:hypothetical protein GIB67_041987 [Kingdonia uniflora]